MRQDYGTIVARLGVLGVGVILSISLGATEQNKTDNVKMARAKVRCRNCIVSTAKLICAPRPVYPELAGLAHVVGQVRFGAVIGADGAVNELRLLSGHPLIVAAAMQAAKRYRYKPAIAKLGRLVPIEEALLITVDVRPNGPEAKGSTGCPAN